MKILVTGNPNFGLAESISKIYTDAKFVTKSAGFDLTSPIKQDELSDIALDYDVFVIKKVKTRIRTRLSKRRRNPCVSFLRKRAHASLATSAKDRIISDVVRHG